MKKLLVQYLFLVILSCFFSANLFAQAPHDPGDDPMKADSVKYVIELQLTGKNQSTSPNQVVGVGKDNVIANKKSGNTDLGKNDDEHNYSSSR
jgi:hypothetical protein